MNFIHRLLFLLTVSFLLISCEEMNERVLPSCTGKSGELLVVVDSSYYNNKTGAAIQSIFAQEQVGLPQREALFDIIQVPHHSFARMFQSTRNIIMVNIEPQSKIKLTVTKDVWASSQLVVAITAPSDTVAAETISKNAEALLAYFNDKELERLYKKYQPNAASKNAQLLTKKYQLSLHIDDLYFVAKKTEDFIWLRKEMSVGEHPVSQGIIIYTYPYVSDSTFEIANLVAKRNEFTKKYVKGGVEKSYMASYVEYVPAQKEINFNGIYANELRGLWYMQGDFMGGPYINYTLIDEQRNRVICLDGYVFAPKFDKREYLRELEALIKTITF
ncbi:MAG: hypothetical protein COX70_02225 [Flavobacteriales bacterium CG_4_10_14_0_2_um_filter_32_8]|nr:MAG: hypothetical protein COX70_02225 [Flavobacteriales bacterium CG_4_10_14_0_2_um_filter_32_8]PJB14384.1 MAG: hypothetical protein CO118_08920 [Flavobacteriales bacterium CG_4_9_14_3_um_filter_32_8]